ncbi:hypothetical protein L3Q82_006067 [Scortum barcoo]|uniref:Uncharacterized protein n=1 Tax=Scortum barcoo TaxID=214431 RepID=A0ACB8X2K5_9TELE|nr:hypothetical protein L3Q82_006067 [Scortum barcoo]
MALIKSDDSDVVPGRCRDAHGMFGRCHSVPVKEVYTYDVSPSVVQRFRTLLEKLSNRDTHSSTLSDISLFPPLQIYSLKMGGANMVLKCDS